MQQFSFDNSKELTRTTHAHDASRRAVQVRIVHAVELRCQKLVRARGLQLNRASKVSIIYTWLVKTLHNVLSSFELSLVFFLPS